MLDRESVLNVLKKYGYNSLNRAPFLYQDKKKIGIYFIWPHKHYGNLERILFFNSLEEVEEEVYKYWWFSNNKNKYPLSVLFDDYETVSPKVIYTYKGNPLTLETIKSLQDNVIYFPDPKDKIEKQELLRTATILILILKEKLRLQTETYNNVQEMKGLYQSLKEEFQNKLSLYKKGVLETQSHVDVIEEEQNDETETLLLKLKEELNSLQTIEDIQKFINILYTYFINIETSTYALQNNYLLNRYPYEIDDMRKKIAILEEALNTKKKLFQTKQDPYILLASVDNASPCKKMVDVKTYIENERKQKIEKYQHRDGINENVLGDYLVSFEKLDIELPPMIQNNYYEEFDKEDLIHTLKKMFNDLSEKEKSACYIASSFLRDCLSLLLQYQAENEANITEVINKLILENKIHYFNEAYSILDDYLNVKIRVKYFTIIKMKTFETFMLSLIEVIDILKKLNQTLNKSFYAYYVDREKDIINLYLKNIVHLNKKESYIAKFMPNVPLYYSPLTISRQLDIINNNELIERNTDTIFLLKNKVDINKSEEKQVVVQYEIAKMRKKNYTIVETVKEKNRCTYYNDMIYNKVGE